MYARILTGTNGVTHEMVTRMYYKNRLEMMSDLERAVSGYEHRLNQLRNVSHSTVLYGLSRVTMGDPDVIKQKRDALATVLARLTLSDDLTSDDVKRVIGDVRLKYPKCDDGNGAILNVRGVSNTTYKLNGVLVYYQAHQSVRCAPAERKKMV